MATLPGLNYDGCSVYLDDLIMFRENKDNRNTNLRKVFPWLRLVNLKLSPARCEFLKKQLFSLIYVKSSEGISPDTNKISVLKRYPVPTNIAEVKWFVACVNNHRKYIPHFAELTKLTKKSLMS